MLNPSPSDAQVPHLIRYQGQAVDASGVPLEGPYDLTVRLYAVETGGTPLWEEPHPAVPLAGGHFSLLLGSRVLLANVEWTAPLWLAVQVNGEPELSPRQQITSVPLAITAERLAVPVTTSTITDDDNALVPSGAIILWTGTSCPAGYTRLSALDGKFLVSGSSFNAAAGGSNTHAHGAGSFTAPSHSHSGSTGVGIATGGQGAGQGGESTHYHTFSTSASGSGGISGTSASADSRPEFATVLLCQKD